MCVNDGPPHNGLFVGETSAAIYLGVGNDDSDRGNVVEISKDRVGEVWIGQMPAWAEGDPVILCTDRP